MKKSRLKQKQQIEELQEYLRILNQQEESVDEQNHMRQGQNEDLVFKCAQQYGELLASDMQFKANNFDFLFSFLTYLPFIMPPP